MALLTGPEIIKQVKAKRINITPFTEEQVNPNSYDVRLSPILKLYTSPILDPKKVNDTQDILLPEEGAILQPNKIYLAKTNEWVHSDFYVPMIEGKSSLGRLGISAHICAGFGDLGFAGYFVLEIQVVQPTRIYPNMKIGQIAWHTIEGEPRLYSGKYQQQTEVTASKSFKDFK